MKKGKRKIWKWFSLGGRQCWLDGWILAVRFKTGGNVRHLASQLFFSLLEGRRLNCVFSKYDWLTNKSPTFCTLACDGPYCNKTGKKIVSVFGSFVLDSDRVRLAYWIRNCSLSRLPTFLSFSLSSKRAVYGIWRGWDSGRWIFTVAQSSARATDRTCVRRGSSISEGRLQGTINHGVIVCIPSGAPSRPRLRTTSAVQKPPFAAAP